MRPKLQKQRVLKLVGRIILPKHGYNTPQIAAELWFRVCPGVHTRDPDKEKLALLKAQLGSKKKN
jgi:hypothetical protein